MCVGMGDISGLEFDYEWFLLYYEVLRGVSSSDFPWKAIVNEATNEASIFCLKSIVGDLVNDYCGLCCMRKQNEETLIICYFICRIGEFV